MLKLLRFLEIALIIALIANVAAMAYTYYVFG